ncbi:HAMP domain-containing histidine kinase [bacterium]|nr:HAMP domain-containing histidine kinase [bacterium]
MRMRTTSAIAAAIAFTLLSLASWGIFRGQRLLYSLEARNEAEQTMTALFTSLKNYDDFGAAIEQNPALKARVVGLGLFDAQGGRLWAWGEVPERFAAAANQAQWRDDKERQYAEDPAKRSLRLILRPTRMIPPPPRDRPEDGKPDERGTFARQPEGEKPPMLEFMRKSEVLYLELRQDRFWNKVALLWILFAALEACLAATIFLVRLLFLRNREYRETLERQKKLVVLGTAASTLAHEIKNPLLAIRLQASILEKTLPEASSAEVAIIKAEVDRLSKLTTRVNDFLRDPLGQPELIDPAELANDIGRSLCGRDLAPAGQAGLRASIDPERCRSILENLIRNALESGGDAGKVEVAVSAEGGAIHVDVLDRGAGIAPADRARIFDPFFTTKSRGTGIGLAICERFATAAGGRVELSARDGGGTRARLTLPRRGGAKDANP